jgi:protein SCO1/2
MTATNQQTLGLAVLVASIATGVPACSTAGQPEREASAPELRGQLIPEPLPRPDFTLLDTSKEPYDFRAQTDGQLTLLFFGYTYCPDVCPLHMANIAEVLGQMTPSEALKVNVVFVTTDPARDTPERLRTWLDAFDRRFVGLTGTQAAVDTAQLSLGLRPGFRETENENYSVAHAAAVFAFTADDLAHVVYPFGIRQADWAADLPTLLHGPWSGD